MNIVRFHLKGESEMKISGNMCGALALPTKLEASWL
jgi:hypothetical protein